MAGSHENGVFEEQLLESFAEMNSNICNLIKVFSNFETLMSDYMKGMSENSMGIGIGTSKSTSTSTSTRASTGMSNVIGNGISNGIDIVEDETPPPALTNNIENENENENENNIDDNNMIESENDSKNNERENKSDDICINTSNELENGNVTNVINDMNDMHNMNVKVEFEMKRQNESGKLRSLDSEDSMSFEEPDHSNQVAVSNKSSNNSHKKTTTLSKTPNSKFTKYYFQSHNSSLVRTKAKSMTKSYSNGNGSYHSSLKNTNKKSNSRSSAAAASTRARLRSLAKSTDFDSQYDFTPSYAQSAHITYDSNGNVKNGSSHSGRSSSKSKNHRRKTLKSYRKNTSNNNATNNNNNNSNTSSNDSQYLDSEVNGLHKSKSQTDILHKYKHKSDHIYLNTENRLTINVGGTLFETTINTLAADQGSMLSAMFSGRFNVEKDENGAIFIDRDPTHFRHILNFLRDGVDYLKKGGLLQQPEGIVNELLQEARYYNIRPLVDYIMLQQMRRNKKKGDELTHEKQYKLVTDVKMDKFEDTFNRVTGNDGFDFENWMFIPPYKTARNNYTQSKLHMLFSKKLSCAEVRLLDRLTNIR